MWLKRWARFEIQGLGKGVTELFRNHRFIENLRKLKGETANFDYSAHLVFQLMTEWKSSFLRAAFYVRINCSLPISRFPFNWKTPIGYILALASEMIAAFWTQLVLVPNGCFLIGSCWFVVAFVDDIVNDVSVLNRYGKWMGNAWKLEQQLYFIVQNIVDVQQLSAL